MPTTQGNQSTYRVVIERNLPMRTRDGVTLYADIYRPDAEGRFPVLVVRTPFVDDEPCLQGRTSAAFGSFIEQLPALRSQSKHRA
jgi:predicted acyl esterase